MREHIEIAAVFMALLHPLIIITVKRAARVSFILMLIGH